eukprot:12025095-Alexandrium_andersonii.AAC.1
MKRIDALNLEPSTFQLSILPPTSSIKALNLEPMSAKGKPPAAITGNVTKSSAPPAKAPARRLEGRVQGRS